jgi:tetrapyrrole methylase family protein/MazG family protein
MEEERVGILFVKLVKIMERLRSENGCPWDREQTHDSLKPFLIEEAYEALEALEARQTEKYMEELGDLLFQIVFQAQISTEQGEFTMEQLLETISEKMIRRHPHVFSDVQVANAQEVLFNWEEIKRREKGGKGERSALDGIPRDLPALLRAHRLQDRASRLGFDWPDIEGAYTKVEEEMTELKSALEEGDRGRMEEELGDLFFSLVNIARFIEVNPEEALRKTIGRFVSRFHHIEEVLNQRGRDIEKVNLEEMERLWQEAKGKEKGEEEAEDPLRRIT